MSGHIPRSRRQSVSNCGTGRKSPSARPRNPCHSSRFLKLRFCLKNQEVLRYYHRLRRGELDILPHDRRPGRRSHCPTRHSPSDRGRPRPLPRLSRRARDVSPRRHRHDQPQSNHHDQLDQGQFLSGLTPEQSISFRSPAPIRWPMSWRGAGPSEARSQNSQILSADV